MPIISKTILALALILAATALGYVARRRGWVQEHAAKWLMTAIVVFGYSPVSFLSIWKIHVRAGDAWLPVLGGAQLVLLALVGMFLGRLLGRDLQDRGLMGMACAIGNTGLTMGQLVLYLLFGVDGIGRGTIFALMWYPMMVLVLYPMARHYAGRREGSLLRLILRSLFDWRSIGLPISLTGLALSLAGVPQPAAIEQYKVVDALMLIVLPVAYFSIGLRLHLASMASLWRFIAALSGVRFLLGPAVAYLLALLTYLSPFPLPPASLKVLLVNSSVPTAITMVAVANMFQLKPRDASVLFVTNTVLYLAVVMPLVLWLLG